MPPAGLSSTKEAPEPSEAAQGSGSGEGGAGVLSVDDDGSSVAAAAAAAAAVAAAGTAPPRGRSAHAAAVASAALAGVAEDPAEVTCIGRGGGTESTRAHRNKIVLLASTIPPELFHGSACGLWMWTTTTSMSNHNKPQEDQEQTEEVCRRRKSTLNLKGKELRALFSPPTYLPHFACSHAWQIDWLASWLASWLAGRLGRVCAPAAAFPHTDTGGRTSSAFLFLLFWSAFCMLSISQTNGMCFL